MSGKTILIWFRNDLRIHDNEILIEAVKRAEKVIPVYCFDPRYFEETEYGTRKTGVFRAQFLIESVENLRSSLRSLGGDLLVRIGKPEKVLSEICRRYHVSEVYHHREVAEQETLVSALVEEALWKQHINLKHFIGHTLYHKEDLPFPVRNIPNSFSLFRKKIERDSIVRPCFETPGKITVPLGLEVGDMPLLTDLIPGSQEHQVIREFKFKGGETEGIAYLQSVIAEGGKGAMARTGQTVLSVKLSPWLSMGCVSARKIFWEINTYKKQLPQLYSKIISELEWRDYFRFMIKKHGSIMPDSTKLGTKLTGKKKKKFEDWKHGNTGEEIIDACMHQLNATGYISDLCRQCTASYLVNEMGINWAAGAAYFEEMVIDFSPASNLGSWASVVGSDVLSANPPVTITYNKIAEEEDIKRWLTGENKVFTSGV